MLSEIEKKEIRETAELLNNPSAACIDALKIVQKHHGWVTDESVESIANELKMSFAEVDSIATFYTRIYRQPVGRNVILICDSVSCMIMGSQTILEYITSKLGIKYGETTNDGRFTLLPVSCLGDCNNSPSIMINEDHFHKLTVEKIDEIFDNYK